jgi:WD40 repeat protein
MRGRRFGLGFGVAVFCLVGGGAGRAGAQPAVLEGHTEPVYAAAFTPDGKWLVTAGFDATVRLWDVEAGKLERTLTGHTGLVLAVAVSRDGSRIASGGLDRTIKLWDLPTSEAPAGDEKPAEGAAAPDAKIEPTASLTGHGDAVYGLAFDETGARLFSTSNDKTARVWDVEKKQAVATLSNTANGTLYGIDVAADGGRLVVAGADNSVRLFDTKKNTQIRRFTGPEYALYDVALSPDGKTIAAGGMGLGGERPVYLWDVEREEPTKRLVGHADDCYAVAFNAAGDRLLTVGYAGAVKIWDVAKGEPVFETELGGVTYSGTYAPDGTRIAVCGSDGKVHFVEGPEAAR